VLTGGFQGIETDDVIAAMIYLGCGWTSRQAVQQHAA